MVLGDDIHVGVDGATWGGFYKHYLNKRIHCSAGEIKEHRIIIRLTKNPIIIIIMFKKYDRTVFTMPEKFYVSLGHQLLVYYCTRNINEFILYMTSLAANEIALLRIT